jgi:predicted component of type VI protein secretion system
VTFGRARGTPPLHVQLLLPTVSRRHARMRYTEDGWRIMNLSRTNPLVVNGEVLESEAESRKLYDGDRIEMGEIVFVFRER